MAKPMRKEWSDPAKINYAKQTLRRSFCKTAICNECLGRAKRKVYKTNKDGSESKRYSTLFTCAKCRLEFTRKEVEVDHKKAVGLAKNMDEYVLMLYCDITGLQVLCKDCHKAKSKRDITKIRRTHAK